MKILCVSLFLAVSNVIAAPPLDMAEMRDASTLDVEVIADWHEVSGAVPTRQKLITIRVGELWPGQDLRAPVRFIVPADSKAKGFLLTGGNQTKALWNDAKPRGLDEELLREGVGLVRTVVETLGSQGRAELEKAMNQRFLETLNPRYSIQYWGWPATLCRSITAAYAEANHFEAGNIMVSGGSKNGASPSVSLIADDRITAQFGTVSPLWDSPLRLCDRAAWDALEAHEASNKKPPHRFLGGTFGPVYNREALAAGRTWEELEALANEMADHVFISRNRERLERRGVELLFEPGTHDFVCFDLPEGSERNAWIPLYLAPNTGHGKRAKHPGALERARNRDVFATRHFFGMEKDPFAVPKITTERKKDVLLVEVAFPAESPMGGGRIYWMFDRAPNGSNAYLADPFPAENWAEMRYDEAAGAWRAEIPLEAGAKRVDLFSSHPSVNAYRGGVMTSAISSPYVRVEL